jgi:cyclopropane-fatty-acyl-phospholipid synthase
MTIESAREIVQQTFGRVDQSFCIRLWDESEIKIGNGEPTFTLAFRDADTFDDLLRSQDVYKFAIAFVENRIDIEGDFYAGLLLKDAIKEHEPDWISKLKVLWKLGLGSRHTLDRDMGNVQAHYDLSNEFYQLFLDRTHMAYSCAYFHEQNESLEDAQTHKMDLTCRKLRLKPGERFLDVGCGWGGLVIHAAKHYGVKAHGLTLSKNQYELAKQRVHEAGLEDLVTIELRDYRDLQGDTYDKIASIGMYEHVGISQYPKYFQTAWDLLRPGGLFLNHGITIKKNAPFTGETKFMFTYIFPNGELDFISHTQDVAEGVGFEVLNVESLRPHYAKTLRHWADRLIANEEAALRSTPKQAYRAWKLYMAGSALAFEDGRVSVYQSLYSKKVKGPSEVPLTPHDVYGTSERVYE